jgi:hypothetical protein
MIKMRRESREREKLIDKLVGDDRAFPACDTTIPHHSQVEFQMLYSTYIYELRIGRALLG